jgi:chromate transport protein ChrA
MVIASIIMLAQTETTFREPAYFGPLILGMLVLGAVASLIAAVLGFARARAFGPMARWFSFAAVSLILFHLQFILLGFGALTKDSQLVFSILSFFNIFIIIAAVCAIMGFIRMTSPR